jgi:glutathionyl-hydroquinone reductase
MVKGLQRFMDHFKGFENSYVLIGGAACDVWLTDRELPFRVTKDLDLVLIVEAMDPVFVKRFWAFIQTGR